MPRNAPKTTWPSALGAISVATIRIKLVNVKARRVRRFIALFLSLLWRRELVSLIHCSSCSLDLVTPKSSAAVDFSSYCALSKLLSVCTNSPINNPEKVPTRICPSLGATCSIMINTKTVHINSLMLTIVTV